MQCRLHNVDPRFVFEDISPFEKIKNTIVDTQHYRIRSVLVLDLYEAISVMADIFHRKTSDVEGC